MEFIVGEKSPGAFTVTITFPDGATKTATRPFPDAGFRALTWLGIISSATEAAEFALDDLRLKVQ